MSSLVTRAVVALALGVSISAVVLPVAAKSHSVAGHVQSQGKWPQASLQAQAVRQVPQDSLRITLATEVSGATQSEVSEALGAAVAETLAEARKNTSVKSRSGTYRVWPMNDQQGRISNWRGRAEVLLESTDIAATSALAGKLSGSMPVSSLYFYLSPQARASNEAELLNEAAAVFDERAQAVASAFGYERYEIREISVGGAGARFESAPRMLSAVADKAGPVPVEPGTEDVSVSISGSVFLRSRQ